MLVTRHLVSGLTSLSLFLAVKLWLGSTPRPGPWRNPVTFSFLIYVSLCFISVKFCCFSNVYRRFNGHSQSSVTDSDLGTSPTQMI